MTQANCKNFFPSNLMYYYIDAQNKPAGPVTADQLENFGVTPETYVWKSGMTQWVKAGDIEELGMIFKLTRTIPNEVIDELESNYYNNTTNNSITKWFVCVVITVIISLAITVCIVYINKKQKDVYTDDETQNVEKQAITDYSDTLSKTHQTIEILKKDNYDVHRINK